MMQCSFCGSQVWSARSFEKCVLRFSFVCRTLVDALEKPVPRVERHCSQIWEAANLRGPQSGSLRREDFYLAMRLVAMAQNGLPATREAISVHGRDALPPPKLEGIDTSLPQQEDVWAMRPQDRANYDATFVALDKESTGFVDGRTAAEYFRTSGLPKEILRHIWSLADADTDMRLHPGEFRVGLHLVTRAQKLQGRVPPTLPPTLQEEVKDTRLTLPAAQHGSAPAAPGSAASAAGADDRQSQTGSHASAPVPQGDHGGLAPPPPQAPRSYSGRDSVGSAGGGSMGRPDHPQPQPQEHEGGGGDPFGAAMAGISTGPASGVGPSAAHGVHGAGVSHPSGVASDWGGASASSWEEAAAPQQPQQQPQQPPQQQLGSPSNSDGRGRTASDPWKNVSPNHGGSGAGAPASQAGGASGQSSSSPTRKHSLQTRFPEDAVDVSKRATNQAESVHQAAEQLDQDLRSHLHDLNVQLKLQEELSGQRLDELRRLEGERTVLARQIETTRERLRDEAQDVEEVQRKIHQVRNEVAQLRKQRDASHSTLFQQRSQNAEKRGLLASLVEQLRELQQQGDAQSEEVSDTLQDAQATEAQAGLLQGATEELRSLASHHGKAAVQNGEEASALRAAVKASRERVRRLEQDKENAEARLRAAGVDLSQAVREFEDSNRALQEQVERHRESVRSRLELHQSLRAQQARETALKQAIDTLHRLEQQNTAKQNGTRVGHKGPAGEASSGPATYATLDEEDDSGGKMVDERQTNGASGAAQDAQTGGQHPNPLSNPPGGFKSGAKDDHEDPFAAFPVLDEPAPSSASGGVNGADDGFGFDESAFSDEDGDDGAKTAPRGIPGDLAGRMGRRGGHRDKRGAGRDATDIESIRIEDPGIDARL